MRQYDVRDVQSNGTVTWVLDTPAVAFELRPQAGCKGYPVEVVVNPDDSGKPPVVLVEGPHGEPAPGSALINKLTVTGARPGDKWQLFTQESQEDRRRVETLTDARGNLLTRCASGDVLFSLDTSVDGTPFAALGSYPGGSSGTLFINPPGAGSSVPILGGRGTAWDVSRYSRVLFGVEQYQDSTPQPCSLKAVVYGAGREDAWDAVARVDMGTAGEFGYPTGSPGPGAWDGECGYVQLGGAVPERADTYTADSPRLLPFLHFALPVVGGTDPELFRQCLTKLRVYAIAW